MRLTWQGKAVGYSLLGLLMLYNYDTIINVIATVFGCIVVMMFAKSHQ